MIQVVAVHCSLRTRGDWLCGMRVVSVLCRLQLQSFTVTHLGLGLVCDVLIYVGIHVAAG